MSKTLKFGEFVDDPFGDIDEKLHKTESPNNTHYRHYEEYKHYSGRKISYQEYKEMTNLDEEN